MTPEQTAIISAMIQGLTKRQLTDLQEWLECDFDWTDLMEAVEQELTERG